MRLALLFVLVLGVACSSNRPPGPGEPDAGGPEDSGSRPDGGTPEDDGGTREDGGSTDDGGTPGDGGTGEEDAGSCEPPTSVRETILVPGLNTPRRLAVDATDLYISESHSLRPGQVDGEGQLLRLPRAGGDVVSVAKGFIAPDAIAVDSKNIYVLDQMGLWRVNKATGERGTVPIEASVNNVITGGTEVLATRVNGRDVVVVATGARRLIRVDTVGATPSSVVLFEGAPGTQVRGARVDGINVWFLVTGGGEPGLYRAALDESTPPQRVDPSITSGTSLELTPTHFLITEGTGGAGRVLKVSRPGGDSARVLAEGLQGPMFPVELNGAVYFKESVASGSAFLRRVRGCPPGITDAVGPEGTGPGGLIVDGNTLLYTSQESGTRGAVGRIP
ncbi:signal integration modulator SinM [Myxococcus landrumensis]|uniref:Signal integration modulator SinM n=1 Tax=Myxococcus landrumensis TaxID=2813577 RepID=A0ABX7N910_9BACT|nr:signal integration modulator SinM [Myxococcus landrumus]QSQ14874.1 signal integration modulator SinM [Myxococcus landrumus]